MSKRTIIVGDVHGCLAEFTMLVNRVGYRPGVDRLIVAGDLVDRGVDSAGVISYAMSIGAEAVQGNHDAKLLRRLEHVQKSVTNPKYRNPMYPDPDQEYTISRLTDVQVGWLRSLPYHIVLPEYNVIVVHAGFVPGVALGQQIKEIQTMVRYISLDSHKMLPLVLPGFRQPANSIFWANVWDQSSDVIFGHTVVGLENIKTWDGTNGGRCYGIDTGCVFGGRLSAIVLDPNKPWDRSVVQVNALREYCKYGSTE